MVYITYTVTPTSVHVRYSADKDVAATEYAISRQYSSPIIRTIGHSTRPMELLDACRKLREKHGRPVMAWCIDVYGPTTNVA